MTKEKRLSAIGLVALMAVVGYWLGVIINWAASLAGVSGEAIMIIVSVLLLAWTWYSLVCYVSRKGKKEEPMQVFYIPFEARESCELLMGKKFHWHGASGTEIMEGDDDD